MKNDVVIQLTLTSSTESETGATLMRDANKETQRERLHINTSGIDNLASVSKRKRLTDSERARKEVIFEAYDKRPDVVARRERMTKHHIKKLREENN